jgi:type IV secretory pathway component VirB8
VNAITKISPWRAKPLTEASKSAKFRAVMDLSAERVILGRSAIIAGWSVGVVGTLMLGASIYGWVTILPLKTIQNEIWVADKTTGIISHPVSLQDAARTFGAATERNYLRQYVEARVGYLKQMDKENDHLVKIMSSKDEQSHYEAERQDPNGPIKRLGKDEYAKIINLRYFPQTLAADGTTRQYIVHFTHQTWHEGDKTSDEPWTATVTFQFHPELPMYPDDRDKNPGGFQAISFSVNSDIPDTKRQ